VTVPGLCSVTFRQLPADEVVALAADAGLEAIEWGADVHVPPGDERTAARLRDAGVPAVSYGSYLQAGTGEDPAPVLDTAVALGVPNVRVWARGRDRAAVTADLARITAAADERRLTISLEYHPGTWTETAESTLQLLADVDAPNLFTYWQPHPGGDDADLADVAAHVSHLHVFTWDVDAGRHPLADGEAMWRRALAVPTGRWPGRRVAFLEFVRDDEPSQLRADAATLRAWLGT
jgi:3-dehydroshikimate dehydratase